MADQPLVTFGFVNCNRLYYLRSCVESLLVCADDYPNKELIIIDNASVESGTDEYLELCMHRGIRVLRTTERDPANEFARAVNTIVREANGEFIAPLQGDMQFILKGDWLQRYIKLYSQHRSEIGSMLFDAQRTLRNNVASFSPKLTADAYSFVLELSRFPVSCSADVLYSREVLDLIGPFSENNQKHEGGLDSENDMRERLRARIAAGDSAVTELRTAVPIFPPAVAIYTDPRGTNARIRGDKRYGKYWPAKDLHQFQYYHLHHFDVAIEDACVRTDVPYGIENIAVPVRWEAPIDENGNWKKNPVRPENCNPDDVEDIV